MRLMTFNLRSDSIFDIKNRWEKRKNLVSETVMNYLPDVLGVQELTPLMFLDLKKSITGYESVGMARSKRFFPEKNDLFVKNGFNIKKYETFWLSKKPQLQGSSVWYSLYPRICTTALVEKDGFSFRVYNTHLDCILSQAREYGIKKILDYIEVQYEKEKAPIILMGDFNATPSSRVIKNLVDGKYIGRRFVAVQEGHADLYNHTTMSMFKGREQGAHIDYIFVSEEFKIEDVKIIDYSKEGKYPSDHYPLLADVELC